MFHDNCWIFCSVNVVLYNVCLIYAFINHELFYCTDIVGSGDTDIVGSDDTSSTQPISVDGDDGDPFRYSEESNSDDDEGTKRPKKKKSLRVKWTDIETKEIHKYFASFLQSKITPGRVDCQKAISKSKVNGGQLHRRSSPLIIKKISNMNRK